MTPTFMTNSVYVKPRCYLLGKTEVWSQQLPMQHNVDQKQSSFFCDGLNRIDWITTHELSDHIGMRFTSCGKCGMGFTS